jgi:hypothetical protein
MKAARAIVYLRSSTEAEMITVEFRCWEQLYASIQWIQCTNPDKRAGLEGVIDPISHDFPIFEWQIPPRDHLMTPVAKPKPLIIQ